MARSKSIKKRRRSCEPRKPRYTRRRSRKCRPSLDRMLRCKLETRSTSSSSSSSCCTSSSSSCTSSSSSCSTSPSCGKRSRRLKRNRLCILRKASRCERRSKSKSMCNTIALPVQLVAYAAAAAPPMSSSSAAGAAPTSSSAAATPSTAEAPIYKSTINHDWPPTEPGDKQCYCTTTSGRRCTLNRLADSRYCPTHQNADQRCKERLSAINEDARLRGFNFPSEFRFPRSRK